MTRVVLTGLAVAALWYAVPAGGSAAPALRDQPSAEGLTIYFVDVEGGQATLIVTPERQAMLIDAGFPGFDDRDAKRILAAARDAGVTRLEYIVLTHFHQDHIGGVPGVVAALPVGAIVDHDVLVDSDRLTLAAFQPYEALRRDQRLIHPKPGDRLSLKGVDVTIVSAGGQTAIRAVPGGGQPNPSCEAATTQVEDFGENSQSVGVWLRYGKFRFLDLGDLYWNKLLQLVCPTNLLGEADVYLVAHHGNLDTNLPQLLTAVKPRVAVINNGPTKGAAPETLASLRALSGLEGVWQLHRSNRQGAENFADDYIANLDSPDEGHWLKLAAKRDGSFRIVNQRNGYTQQYSAAR